MKKYNLILILWAFFYGQFTFAQNDINIEVPIVSANPINVSGTTKVQFKISNVGTTGSTYQPNELTIIVSLPPTIYNYTSIDVPVGPFFTWTYDSAEGVLIGTNTVAFGISNSETVGVNFTGVSAGTASGNVNVSVNPVATNLTVANDYKTFEVTVNSGPLPVRLISFNGKKQNNGNLIKWEVLLEQNFSHYELEKSLDNKEFVKIAKVNATSLKSYSFFDIDNQNKNLYYRLKMVDLDGQYQFSKTIVIDTNTENVQVENVFPNPVVNHITNLKIKTTRATVWNLKLIDLSGREIQIFKEKLQKGNNEIKLNLKPNTQGNYLLISESQEGVFTQKILINK